MPLCVCVCDEASGRDRKQGNLRELNLEALLEPCRLFLLGGSFNASKEATNKKILILVDETLWALRLWDTLPQLPLRPGGSAPGYDLPES